MTMSRDFKGIWIPKEIWLVSEISRMAVLLWAEIHSLHSPQHGGCYASNDYLCEFMGIKKRQLQTYLKELKTAGLITQKAFNGRFRILLALVPQHISTGIDTGIDESDCAADPQNTAPLPRRILHPCPAEYCAPSIYKRKEDNKETDKGKVANAPPVPAPSDSSSSFGSDGHVTLSKEEHSKLKDSLGETRLTDLIEELNDYIGSTGKKYKSHYSTIKSWARRKSKEDTKKKDTSKLNAWEKDKPKEKWKPKFIGGKTS